MFQKTMDIKEKASLVQFRNAGYTHKNFLDLIPGLIIHNPGLGQPENGLENTHRLLSPLPVNAILRDLRNSAVNPAYGI